MNEASPSPYGKFLRSESYRTLGSVFLEDWKPQEALEAYKISFEDLVEFEKQGGKPPEWAKGRLLKKLDDIEKQAIDRGEAGTWGKPIHDLRLKILASKKN